METTLHFAQNADAGTEESYLRNLPLLKLLAKEYPTVKAASSEIINLMAIRGLPKGTEYFFSDLHGEFEAFIHLLRSASGIIREKISETFGYVISDEEEIALANLIYYPERNIRKIQKAGKFTEDWQRITIYRLVRICKEVSSKFTRSKVRKKMPPAFAYIIDELLHVDYNDDNKKVYYDEIIHSIIDIEMGDQFIMALCNLIQNLTVLENVELPLIYQGIDPIDRRELAIQALTRVGLADRAQHKPTQMSGGQQQRVAIARAISTHPPIIMADEPTGALDSRTGHEVLGFLQQLNKEGSTVILITHDNGIAATARRIVRIADGKIIEDHPQEVDWY